MCFELDGAFLEATFDALGQCLELCLLCKCLEAVTSPSVCSNQPAKAQPLSFLVRKRKSSFPGSDPSLGPLRPLAIRTTTWGEGSNLQACTPRFVQHFGLSQLKRQMAILLMARLLHSDQRASRFRLPQQLGLWPLGEARESAATPRLSFPLKPGWMILVHVLFPMGDITPSLPTWRKSKDTEVTLAQVLATSPHL